MTLAIRSFALTLSLALGPIVFTPTTAFAQASAADVSMARQLGNEGLDLASSGDCAGAVEKLKRAEGLFHAPTTLTVLGECQITTGKLVEGVESLTRVVREDLGPSAPPAFRKAQARARLKLDAARPRLPKLRLMVDGVHGDAAVAVKIDGRDVPSASLGLDRPLDPGPHDVEVAAVGYQSSSAHVVMKEGITQPVKVTLEPVPQPAEPPPVVTPAMTASSTPTTPSDDVRPVSTPARANYAPGAILLVVGIAGVGAGTALGILTLSKASDLNRACQPRNDCPSGEQPTIDSAKGLALGSTVGFGVGIVGVGLGTLLLLKPPKSHPAPAMGFSVQPWFGPTSAGVTGRF